MLDSITKKRIDDLRNILVGKIPSPQSQVEQITTGLIYKFMYDMDQEAVEMGGVPSFFVNDFEKYSWQHLFDPKLSGVQKVQLYGDAIEHMYTNPTAPQLFREIFKNSFLPFKDPATLNMFLKEINEFHYSHSEKLGDAFEYLLSFMGSQGDAGQFRTPRHIIDFVVEIINPQKNESVLDPACGTAGFLISSYKHILNQNTNKKLGDKLTASDRKRIGENLVGYDISPDMTRISLVNMYLHQFASPQIHEYDTLSSEDRWNEYYDVVLANPPFFSPTGGIQPHSRFGVQSTRAEVLFVDYIMEHLKPNGRAGIIVPEGIVFQPGTAYKSLRKKLIEDCLIGVISLPSGVFQPYSGVKTSILILDKTKNKNTNHIYFIKVGNDGFSLGTQRKSIEGNDLPEILSKISNETNDFHQIQKSELQSHPIFSLNLSDYLSDDRTIHIDTIPLSKIAKVEFGTRITKNSATGNLYPVYGGGGETFRTDDYNRQDELIISRFGMSKNCVRFVKDKFFLNDSGLTLSIDNPNCLRDYLNIVLLNSKEQIYSFGRGGAQKNLNVESFLNLEIPLPSIEIQEEIIKEISNYQKIIDGCNLVIENYRPSIEIDPAWSMVKLGELATTEYGTSQKSKDNGKYVVLRMGNLQNGEIDFADLVYSDDEDDFTKLELTAGDVLFNRTNSPELVGKTSLFTGHNQPSIFAGYLVRVKVDKKKLLPEYLNAILNSSHGQKLNAKNVSISGSQANINASKLKTYPIPLPDMDIQVEIVKKLEIERNLIEGNRKLIETYTERIQQKIRGLWSNPQ